MDATTAKSKKTSAVKATAKKTATKAVEKKVTKKPAAVTTPIGKALTQSQILKHIADTTELTKKQVVSVLDELAQLAHRHLKKRGVGEFTIPGLAKCKVARKPATKSRKGRNPFTGEEIVIKAKPARNVVRIRPLKKLKDVVEM